MQAARDRQKSYADLKRKLMEFPKSGDKRYAYLFRLGKGCTFWQRETLNPGMLELFKVVRKRLERFLLKTRVPEELFVEEPVEIMDREVKRLKQSRILLIKVRWNSKRGHEFMWESNGPNSRRNTTPSSQDRTVVTTIETTQDTNITSKPPTPYHDEPVTPIEVPSDSEPKKTIEKDARPKVSPIPFPHRLKKEKEEAQQRKFLENLKQL
ncbi:hypothetical protein Tco_1105673 [Tanacetum coccineum]